MPKYFNENRRDTYTYTPSLYLQYTLCLYYIHSMQGSEESMMYMESLNHYPKEETGH